MPERSPEVKPAKAPAALAKKPVKPRKSPFTDVPWRIRDIFLFAGLWIGSQVAIAVVAKLLAPVWPGLDQLLSVAGDGSNMVASLVGSLLSFVIGFGVFWGMLRRAGRSWSALGWRRVNWLKAIGMVALILVMFLGLVIAAFALVSWLVPGFNANQAQTNEFTNPTTGTDRQIAFVALVLLPPILEETIFRGLVFPAIAKRAGIIWGAVVSSALFALLHGQANIGVYTFILGLVLCTMYVKFRSIIPGILLHMVNNYLAFLALGAK
ncbi:MAG TPA: type II CAAX endopeptidase family protein [Candidatus Saccharimonadia bacterium]